jgi:hypothetical protein
MVEVTKDDVRSFLEQFHAKMKVFGIIYRDDRGKNQKALEELEIVPSFRKVIIENLKVRISFHLAESKLTYPLK